MANILMQYRVVEIRNDGQDERVAQELEIAHNGWGDGWRLAALYYNRLHHLKAVFEKRS